MRALHEKEKNELKRLLEERGGVRPGNILEILDAFLSTEEHLTEEELHTRLKARGLMMTREEVREALDIFCRFGFAQVKSFQDDRPRYEHRHLGDHHDHMICTRCGAVEEFVNPELERLQREIARERGFVNLQHRLEIYGLCSECASQRRPGRPLCEAEPGERLILAGHKGGNELTRRLQDMGLTNGVEIEVLSKNDGPLVVSCRGCRLALGRGMSEKIMVSPAENGPAEGSEEYVADCPGRRYHRRLRFLFGSANRGCPKK